MLSRKYTREDLRKAWETVEYMELRGKKSQELSLEMKKDLESFNAFKFLVDETDGTVTFTYNCKGEFAQKKTQSICSPLDYFDEKIGKYICVKRALKESFDKAYELIELKA